MRECLFLLSSLTLLQGCAQVSPPDAQPLRPVIASVRAAPLAPPLGWETLNSIHFIVFSAVRPGDYIVTAVCTGPGEVTFYYVVPPGAARSGSLTLISGNIAARFPAQVEEQRITPPATPAAGALTGLSVRASVPIGHPVLLRFLGTGELSIGWGDHQLAIDARPEILPALNRELRSCPVPGR